MAKKRTVKDNILLAVLAILSLAWIYPIFMILFNSLKKETSISTGTAFQPYTVRVSTNCLRIRKGPGTNYGSRGFTGKGIFTIVAEAEGKGASK